MVIPPVVSDPGGAPGAAAVDPARFLRPGVLSLAALPPLTLYVHFPWCVRKCPYCDFNSHETAADAIPEDRYLEALRIDLQDALPLVWGRRVHCVFIGGGTPSLISAAAVDRLLSEIRALLPLEPDAEITLEANPGTADARNFAAYRAAGVNRLSLGIQSFDDDRLKALGRIHDGAQALAAAQAARRHFDNVNLDLMFALPGQSVADCAADLEQALRLSTPHLSLYQLTLEPNTVFAKYPPQLPDEDAAAAMQDLIESRLGSAGFDHYEVSAHARPGYRCRHNLNYWTFGDYLGIGAGAHSKVSFPHRIVRQVRFRQPAAYMARAAESGPGRLVAESAEVSRRDLPFEFMLNALRLTEGFPLSLFRERCGMPESAIEEALARAETRGLIRKDSGHLVPTALGRRFLSDLQAMFLPRGVGEKAPK